MIIGILVGVAGVINYLVPMLIGAQDMAFPRLNAFSYWIAVPGVVLLLSSLALGGFDTGWTGYPPTFGARSGWDANVLSRRVHCRLVVDSRRT